MEHKNFRIIGSLIFLFFIGFITTYNVLTLLFNDFRGKLILKIVPLFFLSMFPIFYYVFYQITIYSLFVQITLFFCIIGDIFLGIYDPNVPELLMYKNYYLILGGLSFLFARCLILLNMILYPAQRFKLIQYENKELVILSHIIFIIPFLVIVSVFFQLGKDLHMYIFIMIYVILGFGFQLSCAFLRIKRIPFEAFYPSLFGFFSILLFNVSDFLLLATLFTKYLPQYWILISDDIYWLSMFLLSISIVRSSYTENEKLLTVGEEVLI